MSSSRPPRGDDLAALRQQYDALRKVIAVHVAHEERSFFPLLDDMFDGAVQAAELLDIHTEEDELADRVGAALASGDAAQARAAIEAWAEHFEHHWRAARAT